MAAHFMVICLEEGQNNPNNNPGCPKCYLDRGKILQGGRSAEEMYAYTMRRKFELQSRGYRVVEVWSCEWMDALRKNRKLRKMWNEMEMPTAPLHPRINCLRGGRVEPFQMYTECAENEVIEHFDIVRLLRII
jgi:hypothetical protein